MTYASVQDIIEEFKSLSVAETGAVLQPAQISRFLEEADAFINSYIASRYAVPVTGTAGVREVRSSNVDTVTDATTYTATINGTLFSFLSGTGTTATLIRDGLIAAINAGFEPVVASAGATSSEYQVTAHNTGAAFTFVVDARQTASLVTAAVVESPQGLSTLRKIEIDMVAGRLAKILKTKIGVKFTKEGIRQDIISGGASKLALQLLFDLQSGKATLIGVGLVTTNSGFSSHATANNIVPAFQKDVEQWGGDGVPQG